MSPFSQWLGARRRDGEEGFVVEFAAREEMLNPFGTLHGGIVAAVMLESVTQAVCVNDPNTRYAIADCRTEFLAPVRLGAMLRVHVEISRAGRTAIRGACSLASADDVVVAYGTAMVVRA